REQRAEKRRRTTVGRWSPTVVRVVGAGPGCAARGSGPWRAEEHEAGDDGPRAHADRYQAERALIGRELGDELVHLLDRLWLLDERLERADAEQQTEAGQDDAGGEERDPPDRRGGEPPEVEHGADDAPHAPQRRDC